ncbi:MAG TPA: hypothetical protein VJV78_36275 [Polyangiales bacterium]|nr:hypothetical protein [Polyangiales bacterium]
MSWLLFGLCSAPACGGQTGEGDESPTQCVDKGTRPLRDDESTPLGFTAQDVLAFAAAPEPLRLQRSGPDASPLTATIALRAVSGSTRLVESGLSRDVPLPDPCRARIEQQVELELSVALPSGDVQIATTGLLRADSRYRAHLSAEFSAADFERLRGFEPEPEEVLARLALNAQLTPAGSAGQLDAELEHVVHIGPQPEPRGGAPRARDYTTSRIANVARWPAGDACAPGEVPVPTGRQLFEISAEQVLAGFVVDQPLRWSDGSETRLLLEPAAVGGVCLGGTGGSEWFEPFDYPPVAADDPALFGQPIDLTIATADGRFEKKIRTHLQFEADKDGGLRRAWLVDYVTLTAGEAGGWSGVTPDDLEVSRSSELRVSQEPAASAAVRGTLTLRRQRPSMPCSETPCAGLPGGVFEILLQGSLN